MTIVCALGFAGIIISTSMKPPIATYIGFVSALAIWAWVEFTFLAGMITGKDAKNYTSHGPTRFWQAFKAISHHEYALLLMLIAIALMDTTAGTGMVIKTFAILWLLRIGAKLALFTGAPKAATEMMPPRIAHLARHFKEGTLGLGLILCLSLTAIALAIALISMWQGDIPQSQWTQAMMLTTLLGLGFVEFLFLALPFHESRLWAWAIGGTKHENDKTLPGKRQSTLGANSGMMGEKT